MILPMITGDNDLLSTISNLALTKLNNTKKIYKVDTIAASADIHNIIKKYVNYIESPDLKFFNKNNQKIYYEKLETPYKTVAILNNSTTKIRTTVDNGTQSIVLEFIHKSNHEFTISSKYQISDLSSMYNELLSVERKYKCKSLDLIISSE